MSLLKPGYVLSVAVHGALIGGAFAMRQPMPHVFKQVAVYIPPPKQKAHEGEPPPPEPVQEKKKPPPPPLSRKTLNTKAPEPAKAAAAAPAPALMHAALDALPDFGISLSGGDMGAGVGVAVPGNVGAVGAGDAPSSTKKSQGSQEKVLHAVGPKSDGAAAADCDEEATKPKAEGFVQPQYTDDARAADIEGRVKLKLTIDAQGNVTNVEVLAGLGHGLDESAIAAAKRMHFTPAMLCGKAQSSTFVVSMRFVLGE